MPHRFKNFTQKITPMLKLLELVLENFGLKKWFFFVVVIIIIYATILYISNSLKKHDWGRVK